VEDGEGEVTPAALGGGLVHLERVLEVEELLGADAVVDEPVERRQERRAALEVVPEVRGIDSPFALHALDLGRLAGVADVCRLHRHRPRLGPAMPSEARRRSFLRRSASSADGMSTSRG
jgi:hypothetical protein